MGSGNNFPKARRLIRHKVTKKYFGPGAQWFDTPEQAVNFEDFLEATQAQRHFGLRDVEYVMSFGDPRYDMIFSLE